MPDYVVQTKIIVWKGKFLGLVRETAWKRIDRIEG